MSHDPHDPSLRDPSLRDVVDQVAHDNDLEQTETFELPEESELEETREFELPEREDETELLLAEDGTEELPREGAEPLLVEDGTEELPGREDADFEATQAFPAENLEPTEELGSAEEKYRAPLVNRSLFRPHDEADDQPTEIHHEPTAVIPAGGLDDEGLGGATAVTGAAVARTPSEVDADVLRSQREAEQRRAIEDEHRRRREAETARQRALGIVAAPAEEQTQAAPVRPAKRTTDKWLPSLGLLLFRWVIAAILGIRGYQMITDIPATRDLMAKVGLPYLEYFPWALAIALLLAALGLVFGFAVRVIGLCVAALAVCVLVMVKWGVVPVFQSGVSGFIGELEVLLAAAGFLLFTLGGGAWGIDGGWRRNRMRDKYGVE